MASFHPQKRKQVLSPGKRLQKCLRVGGSEREHYDFQDGDMDDGECVVVYEKMVERQRQQFNQLIPAEINCGPEDDDDVVIVLESIRTLHNQPNFGDLRTIVTFSEQNSSSSTRTGVMTGCILDKLNDGVVRLPVDAAATSEYLEDSHTKNTGRECSCQIHQVFSEGGAAERAPVQWVPLQQVLQQGLSVLGSQPGTTKEQQELQNKQHQQSTQLSQGHTNQQQCVALHHMLQRRFSVVNPPTMGQEKQQQEGDVTQQTSLAAQQPSGHYEDVTPMLQEQQGDVTQQTSLAAQQQSGHYEDVSAMRQEQQLTKLVEIVRDILAPLLPKVMQQQCQKDSAEGEVAPSLMTTRSSQEQNPKVDANLDDLRLPDDDENEISDTESMRPCSVDSSTSNPSSPDSDNSVSDFTGGSAEKDVVPLGNVIIEESHLPPLGILNRPPVAVGDSVYVMNDIRDPWALGRVKDISSQNNQTLYTVEYVNYKNKKMKKKIIEATGFQLAYPRVQDFRFSVGHRIISIFRDRNYEEYYSGVIAETPKSINQYRYLIFFDNGSTQYVKHEDIRLVVDSSQSVLEDVPTENGDFVQNYLEKYPERAMLKVQEGQYVNTERNGVWYNANVLQVDASLAQMAFPPKGKYVEWIYRGSPRFYQLFEARKRTCRKQFARTKAFARKICNPFIQYTVKEDEELDREMKEEHEAAQELEQSYHSTARMNTSSHITAQYIRLSSTVEPPKRKFYPCYSQLPYKPHTCNLSCMVALNSVKDYRSYRNLLSHLSEPLLYGWTREKVKHSDSASVYYRAPCKLRLRNIEELHKYLLKTKSKLTVDQFDFNHCVRCFSEVVNEECFIKIEDISNGVEAVPIPCINTIDTREPEKITYVTKHVPTSGTYIETDPEFLTCCDCIDDCLDKEKCACWRQTMEGVKHGPEKDSPSNEGYYYKRLFEPLITGIYECNSRCKCSSTCLNRLVQLPMKCKTQVFMTPDRGWGVRTLHDVPKGSYICLYAGLVLSEQQGDAVAEEAGDEYQADLNYIEDAERLKEHYEENPYENELKDACRKRSNSKRKGKTKTSRKLTGKMYKIVTPSTRVLFGRNGRYILDAKRCGNVGRFINHSCNPNLFIQNVFVDTHDLRFPYVAFFTNSFVPANTELTWNYGYDVGSVPDRIIICKCGETNCQGRLL